MSSDSTTEYTTTRKRVSMKPAITVQRSTPTTRLSLPAGGMTIRRNVVSSSFAAVPNRTLGEAGKVSKESVATVMQTRGKEKKEMGDLNSKLANYIDKVKYMEACNKAMTEEIERLRKMKGYTQQRVRDEYEDELKEARQTIDQLSKEMAPLQAKCLNLEDKLEAKDEEINNIRKQKEDLQNQVNKLNQVCGDLEGELASLRRQLESLSKENDMLRGDLQRQRDENDRLRADFEAAVAKQINAENERDALNEEFQFYQDTLNTEVEELRELLANFKSIQPDIQKMWKSEFKDCIKTLSDEYQAQLDKMTLDQQRRFDERVASMESAYKRDNTDSTIVKSENKNLKSQIGDTKNRMADLERENARLRAELESLKERYDDECRECEEEKAELRQKIQDLETDIQEVLSDLEQMRSQNMDLELEIACYRKLLEGEERSMKRIIEDQNRVQSEGGAALASMISSSSGSRGGGAQSSQTSTMSESTGLVRVSRSSKCAISIAEIAQDGTFVRLENGSASKEFDLSNWNLERKHPKGKSSFKFPSNYKLGARKSVKIWSNSFEDEAGPDDLVAARSTCKSWGVGSGEYKLIDESGAEKANSKIDFQS